MPCAEKPPTCVGCPAFNWGIGFVPPTDVVGATVAWVGQGPGEAEAEFSVPFHPQAPSGERLTKWMHRSGFQRTEQAIGNIVQCWLPEGYKQGRPWGNREPTRTEVAACWQRHVGPWLHALVSAGLEHIVPIGVPATKWLLGLPWGKAAERYAGTTQRIELPPLENPNDAET